MRVEENEDRSFVSSSPKISNKCQIKYQIYLLNIVWILLCSDQPSSNKPLPVAQPHNCGLDLQLWDIVLHGPASEDEIIRIGSQVGGVVHEDDLPEEAPRRPVDDGMHGPEEGGDGLVVEDDDHAELGEKARVRDQVAAERKKNFFKKRLN